MYPDYADIRERIKERPTWFDENGVPRYGAYQPAMVNIYADESALFEIACQGCDARALIGVDFNPRWDEIVGKVKHARPNADDSGSCSFGDFPRLYCNAAADDECGGVTMTTDVVRIVEYWVREDREWIRKAEYEFDYSESARSRARLA